MTIMGDYVMRALYGANIWAGFSPNKAQPVEGWNGTHPSLVRLATLGGIIVDVGVWKGQSTITMAEALRESAFPGCVIAVDTFLGSVEHWGMNNRRHGMPDLYDTFLSNVWNAGLSDYVIPMPQTSSTAAAILRDRGIRPMLVHIDASHVYEDVIQDANEYWSLLDPGGYLIGDDYHETVPGVVKAADEFSAEQGIELVIDGPKWIMQKPVNAPSPS